MAGVTLGSKEGTRAVGARAFERVLIGATAVPWVLGVAFGSLGVQVAVVPLTLLLGVAHVATTGFVYSDPEMKAHLRSDPVRYLIAPACIAAAAVVLAVVGRGWVVAGAFIGLQVWQIHHFTRQNLGVFAFLCRARDEVGPSDTERRLFALTGYAGMAGAVPAWARLLTPLEMPAGVEFAGLVPLAFAAVIATRATGRRRWLLAAAVVFYLPLFLLPGGVVAASVAYGWAHGAQYHAMMSALNAGRSTRQARRGVVVLGLLIVLVGVPLHVAGDAGGWNGTAPALFWLFWAVVSIHFIVDAGVWKMRDPAQRAYMKRRFAFL